MNHEPVNTASLKYYFDGILAGDRRVLSKAITLVESTLAAHRDLAQGLVDGVLEHTGKAVRLGITGVPGVGKSTFIESFGMMLIDDGLKVAVLAIDPSSSRSGGSILADKTRMERLSAADGAFIRPSPSGGTLGGVARMTRETMLLCEAAGFDVIIVETVGVGQNEATVAGMVDFFLILMLTGAGDELQGIKKGILELADALAVNKADGDNAEKAEKTRKELEMAMHLMQPGSSTWTPPVLTCSALTMTGLSTIWKTVQEHHDKLTQTGELAAKRKEQALQWMWSLIQEGLNDRFHRHSQIRQHLKITITKVRQGEVAPTTAAQQLLFLLDNR
ncbi:MAG: methylmalonyl Co-A mutase-associated GTPase MeaB [Desulfobacteraceae bacterium]|jgi:LAO/AO transport system kinase